MDDDADVRSLQQASQAHASAPQGRPPRRRWDASLLRLGLMVTLLVAVGAALVYLRVYQRRVTLLRSQQACMNHQLPADTVVYEEQPGRAAELLKRNDGYVAVELGETGAGPPAAGRVYTDWIILRRWAMPSTTPAEPTAPVLFLHERRTVDGDRVVVCVEADRAARRLRVTFVYPGGVTVNPHAAADVHLAPPPQEGLVILSPGRDPLEAKLADVPAGARADFRFFAGQADPADATHFTLPYEWDGRRGEIEMWVHRDRLVYYVDRLFADATDGR
jgi:hypothetical protein